MVAHKLYGGLFVQKVDIPARPTMCIYARAIRLQSIFARDVKLCCARARAMWVFYPLQSLIKCILMIVQELLEPRARDSMIGL